MTENKKSFISFELKRIAGIDQLRYVFAVWVFFTHGGAPPFFKGHTNTAELDFIEKLYGWSINGQAAVIGFFIISGLCIHYPNIKRDRIHFPSFYTARFLRLSLPIIACLLISKLLNYDGNEGILRSILWTLYCEAIYYFFYPIIFWFAKNKHLRKILFLSCIISLILLIVWSDYRNMYFHEIGGKGKITLLVWRTALIAFPCWLSGCLIAEIISHQDITHRKMYEKKSIIFWRIGALLLSTITFPLYRLGLHLGVIKMPFIGLFFSSQFTLLLFGVFAFFWIKREVIMINFMNIQPLKLFEKMGLASYSLYIVHPVVIWSFSKFSIIQFPGYLISWILLVIVLHLFTYIFFILIEKPSHKIAKYFSRLILTYNDK